MHKEFTAIIERDGEWLIAYCPEVPGANGQGRTIEECRQNLADAIGRSHSIDAGWLQLCWPSSGPGSMG